MTYHVVVTAEDIAAGVPRAACACPIARALVRMGHSGPDVECQAISFRDAANGYRVHYTAPPVAIEFMERFDEGEPVDPIEFDMEEWA